MAETISSSSLCTSSRYSSFNGGHLDPPKTDITIIERKFDKTSGRHKLSGISSLSIPIQDFLSRNSSFLPHNNSFEDTSDEEWQTNIFNGELTVTEVFTNKEISFPDHNDEYNLHCLDVCEVVYDVDQPTDSDIRLLCDTSLELLDDQNSAERKDFLTFSSLLRSCKLCNYKTKYPSKLKLHMRIHTGEKPYACDVCAYRSSKSYSLKAHKRTHTGEKPYLCQDCTFACNDPSTLRRHKYTHSGVKPYSCDKCQYKCTRSTHLKRHLMTHAVDGKYKCSFCEFKCETKNAIKVHSRIHTGKDLISCKMCNFSTDDKGTLRRHSFIHTNEKPYSCHICEYRCRRGSHLRRHLKIHERKVGLIGLADITKPLVCPQCGSIINTEDDMKIHKCDIQSQKVFHCNKCSYASKNFNTLKKHKAVHSRTVFSCKHCKRRFSSNEVLNEHLLQHLKVKKHMCKECNYSTNFSSSIRKHRLNHTNNFEYKCDSCSYSAKREPNLERHKLIHLEVAKIGNIKLESNAMQCDEELEFSIVPCSLLDEGSMPDVFVSSVDLVTSSQVHTPNVCAEGEENELLINSDDNQPPSSAKSQEDSDDSESQLMNGINEEPIFRCGSCGFATFSLRSLKKHTFLHTSGVCFSCKYCNFTCDLPRELEKHFLLPEKSLSPASSGDLCMSQQNFNMNIEPSSHSKDTDFSCNKCTYSTKNEALLNEHKTSHGKQWPVVSIPV